MDSITKQLKEIKFDKFLNFLDMEYVKKRDRQLRYNMALGSNIVEDVEKIINDTYTQEEAEDISGGGFSSKLHAIHQALSSMLSEDIDGATEKEDYGDTRSSIDRLILALDILGRFLDKLY